MYEKVHWSHHHVLLVYYLISITKYKYKTVQSIPRWALPAAIFSFRSRLSLARVGKLGISSLFCWPYYLIRVFDGEMTLIVGGTVFLGSCCFCFFLLEMYRHTWATWGMLVGTLYTTGFEIVGSLCHGQSWGCRTTLFQVAVGLTNSD